MTADTTTKMTPQQLQKLNRPWPGTWKHALVSSRVLPNGNLLLHVRRERGRNGCGNWCGTAARWIGRPSLRSIWGCALILPVAIGAMTDSPIFALEGTTDLPDDDDYEVPTDDAPVWWWPSYMVHDLTETLRERGRAVLTSSENS